MIDGRCIYFYSRENRLAYWDILCWNMPAPSRRCRFATALVATAIGVGRAEICNYHDLSWKLVILEAEQDTKAEISHQLDGYIRALYFLVIRQQLEDTHFPCCISTFCITIPEGVTSSCFLIVSAHSLSSQWYLIMLLYRVSSLCLLTVSPHRVSPSCLLTASPHRVSSL